MANRLQLSTLIASAMIGEAVVAEVLRMMTPEQRRRAGERIKAALKLSIDGFAGEKVPSGDAKEIIRHKQIADELENNAGSMFQELLDLASKDG